MGSRVGGLCSERKQQGRKAGEVYLDVNLPCHVRGDVRVVHRWCFLQLGPIRDVGMVELEGLEWFGCIDMDMVQTYRSSSKAPNY